MTLFDTPVLTPILRLLARTALKLTGWAIDDDSAETPAGPCVLIGAPHTSNWDFLLMLCAALQMGITPRWFGKHSLFRFPFGPVMRWMGGIAIDRTNSNRVVDDIAGEFNRQPNLILILAPEGTRSKVEQWKSGFYHIARLAGVPVVMVAIDGEQRSLRLVGKVEVNGDDNRDPREAVEDIRQRYYGNIRGIRPEKS